MSEYETGYIEDEGSYGKGALGALAGAGVGAVVWAVAMGVGYLTGLFGLIIGFAAGKGYDLLKGKHGFGKIPLQILAAVIGLAVGSAAGLCMSVAVNMQETGVAMEHFSQYMQEVLSDMNVAAMIASDVGQGLLCTIGAVVVLRLLENKK